VAFHRQSSKYPAKSMFAISRRNRPSWIFSDRIDSKTEWSKLPKAIRDISFDEPCRPDPSVGYLPQGV